MTRRVVLVRHAAPDLRTGQSPRDWELTPDGVIAARRLRPRLPSAATFASSDEPKAIATLAAATDASVVIDERFGEVCRPAEPIDDRCRAVRLTWVAGALDVRHDSWESPADAAARFAAGLDALVGETVVVATHGMVLTAWLVSVGAVAAGAAAGDFWSRLSLPDLVVVELPDARIQLARDSAADT